jgi:hypothetical protein
MTTHHRDIWINDPHLKELGRLNISSNQKCGCNTKDNHVELVDHDSCVRGRIDTIVCTECHKVSSFKIIR